MTMDFFSEHTARQITMRSTWQLSVLAALILVSQAVPAHADVTTITYTNETDLAIPDDNSAVFSEIVVPLASRVLGVEVYIDVTHPAAEQLVVRLHSPQPWQEIVAFPHDGQLSGADPVGWFPGDFGSYQDLETFVDQITEGSWYVEFAVSVGGDVGTLNEWSLRITYDDAVPVASRTWGEIKRLYAP